MNKKQFSNEKYLLWLKKKRKHDPHFFGFCINQNNQNWGAVKEGLKNSQIQEFLYAVDKFVGTLSSSRQNIEDKIQLRKMDIDVYVRNLQNPSDYITAGE